MQLNDRQKIPEFHVAQSGMRDSPAQVPELVAADWDLVESDYTRTPANLIDWPEIDTGNRHEIVLSVKSNAVPHRIVTRSFDSVDANGIPDSDYGGEQVCYPRNADAQCTVEEVEPGWISVHMPRPAENKEQYCVFQFSWWVNLEEEEGVARMGSGEVWASWAAKIR